MILIPSKTCRLLFLGSLVEANIPVDDADLARSSGGAMII
jgi:hypothetical protein